MDDKLKVMLVTEGTYPFHQGGVSTWCDILVNKVKNIEYTVYSIIMNPFVTQKFSLPQDTMLIKVPLWGTEEPSEHLNIPFSQVYISKRNTVEKVINDRFIPYFKELIDELLAEEKDPARLGSILLALYDYFQEFEYKKSFKSQITWEIFKSHILEYTTVRDKRLSNVNIYSLIQALGWVYRFLIILNTPLPDVHVTHSAAAAFSGIPCVLAKLKNNVPFLLTEHGVYLREQYLSLSRRGYSNFLNTFLVRMIHSVSSLNYHFADQVSPVCSYNTRWEREFGVSRDKIKVIYNGVDKKVFSPSKKLTPNRQPTIVTVARVDPVKDIKTLIRASAIVREKIPDVKFIIYGSVSVPKYFEECNELKNELKLDNTFIFAGHTDDVPAAYRSGDIIVLSSITEAFPYSVVEAMMTSKPVIATDVGGIKEALGDTGVVVNPGQPQELADAVINLVSNPGLCSSLGDEARQRALNYFTIERVLGLYLKSYINLALGDNKLQKKKAEKSKQLLHMERGYALLENGYLKEAVSQLRMALKEDYNSPLAPTILMQIADIYNKLGKFDQAFNELEKAELLMEMKQTA